jgi:hypothetical protein
MFIGLWTFADDEGRLEHQPARLRMQIFPCGSVSLAKVREFLGELTERSLIRIYTVDGKDFLDIPNFSKHQKINRPTPSRLPPYSVSTHGAVSEDSPLERKGKEKEGESAREPDGSPAPTPEGLDAKSWDRWLAYRNEIRKPLKPASIPAAQKALAAFGSDQAGVVEQSIANGWQGLFALKDRPKPKEEPRRGLPILNA